MNLKNSKLLAGALLLTCLGLTSLKGYTQNAQAAKTSLYELQQQFVDLGFGMFIH